MFIWYMALFLVIKFLNKSAKYKPERKIKYFVLTLALSAFTMVKYNYLLNKQNIIQGKEMIFSDNWIEQGTISTMSPLGFYAYDVFIKLKEKRFSYKLQNTGLSDMTEFINNKEECQIINLKVNTKVRIFYLFK